MAASPVAAHPPSESPGLSHQHIAALALLLAMLAANFGFLHFLNQKYDARHNDLLGRQYGARAALQGADPYSPQLTRQIQAVAGHDANQGFDYPALLVVLLAPVASWPWHILHLAYTLVVVPALFLSFWLCLPLLQIPASRPQATWIALLALGSWPVIWGLRLSQPTLLSAVLILPACYLLSREHDLPAGILLALASFKPQFVFLLLPWLLLWTCRRRRWTFAAAYAVALTALLLLAQKLVPGWFPHWLAATVCLTPITRAMTYDQIFLVPGVLLLIYHGRPHGNGLSPLLYRLVQVLLVWTFLSTAVAAFGASLAGVSWFWILVPFLNHPLAPLVTIALLTAPLPRPLGYARTTPSEPASSSLALTR